MDLSYEETMALAIWGCPDYGLTVMRLAYVAELTIDPEVEKVIAGLHDRLFNEITEADYQKIYDTALIRGQHEKMRQLSCQKQRKQRYKQALDHAVELGWTVIKGGSHKGIRLKRGERS